MPVAAEDAVGLLASSGLFGGLDQRALEAVLAEAHKRRHGPLTDHDLVSGGALDEVDRQTVVEIGGQQVLIDIGGADQESFDAFLPLAEEVLGTIQIG